MELYIKCWKHCADFSSRSSREEFWSFFVVNFIITSILLLFAYILLYAYPFFSKLTLCYSLAALLPGIAVCIRRLHDVGRTGWFMLALLIPVVGLVGLMILMALKGGGEENEWGSPQIAEGPVKQ